MNFIDCFDRVRIVNVPSRKDRRSETISEFKGQKFQIKTEKVNFFDAITPKDSGGFPNAGVRGCFLSHLKILEEAKNIGVSNILILEDDIQFSKKLSKYGKSLFEELNSLDWDIAYFGHVLKETKGEAHWELVSQPMQTSHFYAVNGKTLESLIEALHQMLERPPGHPDGGPMHYDGALNTFLLQKNSSVKAYYSSINLGYQRASKTDLHESSKYDNNPLTKLLVRPVRYIKNKLFKFIR